MLTLSTYDRYDEPVSRTAGRTSRKPPSRYHHGNLRQALLEETIRTIRTGGVESVNLREVGRKLGVSRTALYRHFTDKSALLAAVAREGFERFRKDLTEAWTAAGGGLAGLEAMGIAYIRFALRNRSHYRVMFGQLNIDRKYDGELVAEAKAAFQVLVDALVSLQDAGLARRDNPETLANFIWATSHGIAMLALDGQLGPLEKDANVGTSLMRYAAERLRAAIRPETNG